MVDFPIKRTHKQHQFYALFQLEFKVAFISIRIGAKNPVIVLRREL